jgi:hypothetical protein
VAVTVRVRVSVTVEKAVWVTGGGLTVTVVGTATLSLNVDVTVTGGVKVGETSSPAIKATAIRGVRMWVGLTANMPWMDYPSKI